MLRVHAIHGVVRRLWAITVTHDHVTAISVRILPARRICARRGLGSGCPSHNIQHGCQDVAEQNVHTRHRVMRICFRVRAIYLVVRVDLFPVSAADAEIIRDESGVGGVGIELVGGSFDLLAGGPAVAGASADIDQLRLRSSGRVRQSAVVEHFGVSLRKRRCGRSAVIWSDQKDYGVWGPLGGVPFVRRIKRQGVVYAWKDVVVGTVRYPSASNSIHH